MLNLAKLEDSNALKKKKKKRLEKLSLPLDLCLMCVCMALASHDDDDDVDDDKTLTTIIVAVSSWCELENPNTLLLFNYTIQTPFLLICERVFRLFGELELLEVNGFLRNKK